MEANKALQEMNAEGLDTAGELDQEVRDQIASVYAEMNDDFNSPKALARLFEAVTLINTLKDGKRSTDGLLAETLQAWQKLFRDFLFGVFGLEDITQEGGDSGRFDSLMDLVLEIRSDARANKNWGISDLIRDRLQEAGVIIKDSKEGTSWTLN